MPVYIFPTEQETLQQLAEYIVKAAAHSIESDGRFLFVLSGGSSPKKLFELLASDSFRERIEWNEVFFFFGDERYVPHTDPQSNYLMAKKALFEPLGIDDSRVFAYDTSLGPVEAAAEYEKRLLDFFRDGKMQFDLILLGLGDNSHTASLFPYTPVLRATEPGVDSVFLEDQQVFRLTLNAPLINQARQIAFLVYGKGKAEAVHHVLEDERNIEEYPAQLIRSQADWFTDSAAASELRTERH